MVAVPPESVMVVFLQMATGAWLSPTTTDWYTVVTLPFTSVIVHVTIVVPTGNAVEGWLLVMEAIPQLSEQVGGARIIVAKVEFAAGFAVIVAGAATVGA